VIDGDWWNLMGIGGDRWRLMGIERDLLGLAGICSCFLKFNISVCNTFILFSPVFFSTLNAEP